MDWSQYQHHCIWLQTLRIREDTVVSSAFQLSVSMPSTTVSSLLLFGFGTNCRLLSLCPLPSGPSSLDWWASRRLRLQFRDIRPVFISHFSTFLSVCGTWIYRLLPALHAHLPCATLLNSEECALSEKKKRRRRREWRIWEHRGWSWRGGRWLWWWRRSWWRRCWLYSVLSDDDDEQLSHD